jgi:hypothetical protein
MKNSWKKIGITISGAVLIFAGCQTAPVQNTGRNPAMSSKRVTPQPPSDGGDNSGANTSDNSGDQPVVTPPPVVVTPPQPVADTEAVSVTAINGTYSQGQVQAINVHPGDVVQISADVFDETQGVAEKRQVEEFIWSANDSDSDVCVASQSGDCLDTSLFQVNDYGVSFYVPQNMGSQITITVTNANSPNAGSDTLYLNNIQPAYVAPPVIISSPAQYSCSDFNEDCALARQGNWVYIDGQRYFAPFISDPNWAPYQHGYWTWVEGDGWTWVSYDHWGWYTDHYGYWRHHGVYGWIWSPFDDRVYRPAAVTWFYTDGVVGWYPYYDSWNQTHPYWGPERGFDDGYWGGYHEGGFYGPYHPGFYYVGYHDFGANDVYAHRPDGFDGPGTYGSCYQAQQYGAWPGGPDRDSSREYMNARSPNVLVTHADSHQYGNTNMRFPVAVRQVPDQYKTVPGQAQRFGSKPIPVGSVFNHDTAVAPTSNHRGITAPPVVRSDDGTVAQLPPRTQNPARPSGSGSVYHPPAPPTSEPTVPVYHPGHGGNGNNGGGNTGNGGGGQGGHGSSSGSHASSSGSTSSATGSHASNSGSTTGNHPVTPVTPPDNGGSGDNGNGESGHGSSSGSHASSSGSTSSAAGSHASNSGSTTGNHPVTPVNPPNNGGNGDNGNGESGHGSSSGSHASNSGSTTGNHPVTPVTPVTPVNPPENGGNGSGSGSHASNSGSTSGSHGNGNGGGHGNGSGTTTTPPPRQAPAAPAPAAPVEAPPAHEPSSNGGAENAAPPSHVSEPSHPSGGGSGESAPAPKPGGKHPPHDEMDEQ